MEQEDLALGPCNISMCNNKFIILPEPWKLLNLLLMCVIIFSSVSKVFRLRVILEPQAFTLFLAQVLTLYMLKSEFVPSS